jgi:transaldolase/glucose-6-phosphate isomerase
MPGTIEALRTAGQSPWLDFIRRAFIQSGELQRYIDDGWLTGLTSNPTIFKNAISGSTDYDEALEQISRSGTTDPYEAFLSLAVDDIQAAADAFRPEYDRTHAADGFVSHEAPPGIERDYDALVAEARRLFASFERPNVMIKVPGTDVGVRALEQLTADGINVNVTLLFSVERYAEVAEAYIRGLERRLGAGRPIDRVASVASFFVSRIDTKVDGLLPANSPLRGAAGVASARAAYHRFRELFTGRRWERLVASGARVQRPLWASTSTKNPAYPDVMYIDGLVAPDTVNTMPEKTLRAFADHGSAKVAITPTTMAEAEAHLRALGAAGVNMRHVTDDLLEEGLQSFADDFQALLDCIGEALRAGANRWLQAGGHLGPLEDPVLARVRTLGREEVVRRIWSADHTVWSDRPDEIANRLGWLEIDDGMSEEVERLEAFAHSVHREGYRNVVLLGMGGSSLAPAVMGATFGRSRRAMTLKVISTTDPAAIRAAESRIQPKQTLFVVSSKSGTTIETRALFDYFWSRIPDGRHFAAITDAGTPLEALGRERGFRKVFAHTADGGPLTGGANIGGRYSALSYFGLVPAALAGVPVRELLERAHEVHQACHACVPMADNPGAWLGAALGEAALAGRDKLTLALDPRLAALGMWIEQLIAESTGKDGKGILPVVGEPLGAPHVYGGDRLFVAIGEPEGYALDDLEGAGQPVVRIPFRDRQQLGAEFFRWEFATAIAAHVLGIHPFNQPNVQEAKDATDRVLAGDAAGTDAKTPPAREVLESVRPGDYIALLAYTRETPLLDERLQQARVALRDRYRVATTVGYGPSYLHSTGQLHKGGPASGVFLVYAPEERADLDIPGRPYSFGDLKRAQAHGDVASLQAHGRRVAWITKKDIEALAT